MADNDRLHRSLLVKARVAGAGMMPPTPTSSARGVSNETNGNYSISSHGSNRRSGGSPGLAQLKEGLSPLPYDARAAEHYQGGGASDDVVAPVDRVTSPHGSSSSTSRGRVIDRFDESGYTSATARKRQAYIDAQKQSSRRGYVDEVVSSLSKESGTSVANNYTSLHGAGDQGGRSRSASPPPPPSMDRPAFGQGVSTPTRLGGSAQYSPARTRTSSPPAREGSPGGSGGGGGGGGAFPRRGVNWGLLQDSLDIQVSLVIQ
jgi:hypothetical protein